MAIAPEQIKAIRTELGMTSWTAMAEALGVSQAQMQRLGTGKREVDLNMELAIEAMYFRRTGT